MEALKVSLLARFKAERRKVAKAVALMEIMLDGGLGRAASAVSCEYQILGV